MGENLKFCDFRIPFAEKRIIPSEVESRKFVCFPQLPPYLKNDEVQKGKIIVIASTKQII